MNGPCILRFWQVLVVVFTASLVGCPQTIEIPESERRPDAAVVNLAPRPVCSYEVKALGSIAAPTNARPAAQLIRWQKGALLLRAEALSDTTPAKVTLDQITRQGALERSGETSETGASGAVLGLDAVAGGGSIILSLTRPDGRVDLLSLSPTGETAAPVRTIETGGSGLARVLYFQNNPLIEMQGNLFGSDGSGFNPIHAQPDAGVVEPPAFRNVVVSESTLGWIRYNDDGIWLDHYLESSQKILSAQIAEPGDRQIELLWAGDRYLVGDRNGTDIARYVVNQAKRGQAAETSRLYLSGRFDIPSPPANAPVWAWDNSGPAHFGLGQVIRDRTIRFINIALAGQVLDAPISLVRERNISFIDVVWDGSGYIMIWTEATSDTAAELFLTRFSCPDE